MLFNITGGMDMTLDEINEAAEVITRPVDPEANIIFGAVLDKEMSDEMQGHGHRHRLPAGHTSRDPRDLSNYRFGEAVSLRRRPPQLRADPGRTCG